MKIPAEHIRDVGLVIQRLTANGVPIKDIFVEATPGSLELRDDTGSYGARLYETTE